LNRVAVVPTQGQAPSLPRRALNSRRRKETLNSITDSQDMHGMNRGSFGRPLRALVERQMLWLLRNSSGQLKRRRKIRLRNIAVPFSV
jgi:hypothetical protein